MAASDAKTAASIQVNSGIAISRRRVVAFYLTVLLATHVVTTTYRLMGGTWNSMGVFLVANGIMLIPGLTAVLFVRFAWREPVLRTLGLQFKPNRWWMRPITEPLRRM